MNKYRLIFGIILLLGIFVRFVGLGEVPASLHRDEAFLGYNAYSILHTGKDISGNTLPLHLESFIYSPAGYSYFSIPFIKLFDLSIFSVRFASAFFGSLTVFVLYFLARELFYKNKYKKELALVGSFFLAISPWHINLSRTATENTIVTFFITLGIFLFLIYARKSRNLYLLFSFLSFGITLSIYQAPRAFLPLFIPIISTVVIGKKKLFEKKVLLTAVYLMIIVFPVLFIIFSGDLSLRIKSLSIFNHPQAQLVINSEIANDGIAGMPQTLTRAFHNKIINYSMIFFDNYTSHFSSAFLFSDKGFPDRYRIPQMGILYIFELFLIIPALFFLFKKEKKEGLILLSWILISPIGSALTFDDIPNLQRTMISAPAFSILSSYGLFSLYLLAEARRKYLSKIFLVVVSLIIFYSFAYYMVQYYVQAPFYRAWYRNDGYKQLVAQVNEISKNYDRVIITNRESAPTIFFLFFNKYNPQMFQNETKNVNMMRSDSVDFGKYIFTDEQCPVREDVGKKEKPLIDIRTLYVNSSLCSVPEGIRVIKTIKRTDNSAVFYLLDGSN